jgi:signal transduction histidine kinase
MHRRLIILTVIVVAAVCGLGGLGFHAIEKWSQGLEGARLGEFAEVAEQVRQDVKRKLDEFMQTEQQRQYTDYLYSYVPDNVMNSVQLPVLRSPLGDQLSNSFAYGYFQIEPDGNIVSPYYPGGSPDPDVQDGLTQAVEGHFSNIRRNLFPSITSHAESLKLSAAEVDAVVQNATPPVVAAKEAAAPIAKRKAESQAGSERAKAFPIESLKQEAQQTQVFRQQRSIAASNSLQMMQAEQQADMSQRIQTPVVQTQATDAVPTRPSTPQPPAQIAATSDTVQVRVEPFVPLVVPDPDRSESIFGGQIFLLRHVQIESRHVLQGFQLDESRLVAEVEQSARSFVRDGMGFELPQVRKVSDPAADAREAAYTAILDFGFGDLILNLTETDPAWIARRIGELRHIYLGILAIVVAAVGLSLLSLWHNVRAQALLAQKKDDFISAVSHELRTPLTSIRMYTEMLEKNWVKSADKIAEYHRTMRQESERLSRLVENVLDFARLQKGRKNYAFRLGDIDECVAGIVEMMRPYAGQHGFTIQMDLAAFGQSRFDKDAVTQIVVNLVDNAVKYARSAADKTIVVRTRNEPGFTAIEVEDRGPGIPRNRQKKVFEQFYRCEDDRLRGGPSFSQPQTTGMGLGLTLVKHFAEAHGGYVEIRDAQPTGAVLKVALAILPTAAR